MPNKQTLCPYLAKPLDQIDVVNDEHVLPIAIGAPKPFFVRAAESENSRFNTLIDAPFSNEPLIQFLAMRQGVISRSGPVIAKIPATLISSGEPLTLAWSQAGFDLKFQKPVEVDQRTGQVMAVRGYGDDAMTRALEIQRGYAKKKMKVEIGEVVSDLDSTVRGQLRAGNAILWRELFKIAYLMTVWCFQDKAIASASGEEYRRGLAQASPVIKHTTEDIPGISALGDASRHALLSVILGKKLITSVKLFGSFSAVFVTAAEGVGEEGDGACVTIDLPTRTFSQTPALESMMKNVRQHFGQPEAARPPA